MVFTRGVMLGIARDYRGLVEDGLHQDGDDRDSQGLQGVGGKMVFTRVVILGIAKDYRAVGLWGMSLACQWECFGLQEVDMYMLCI